jgi:hypothetical protein
MYFVERQPTVHGTEWTPGMDLDRLDRAGAS